MFWRKWASLRKIYIFVKFLWLDWNPYSSKVLISLNQKTEYFFLRYRSEFDVLVILPQLSIISLKDNCSLQSREMHLEGHCTFCVASSQFTFVCCMDFRCKKKVTQEIVPSSSVYLNSFRKKLYCKLWFKVGLCCHVSHLSYYCTRFYICLRRLQFFLVKLSQKKNTNSSFKLFFRLAKASLSAQSKQPFPSSQRCPLCRDTTNNWIEKNVARFLIKQYSKENINLEFLQNVTQAVWNYVHKGFVFRIRQVIFWWVVEEYM